MTVNQPNQNEQLPALPPSAKDKLWTPANAMTAARPVLGGIAAYKFITGEKGVTPYILGAVISDGEGYVARFFDKYFPQLEIGSSDFGKKWDPIADTAAMLEIATGALISPEVNWQAKTGVGIVLGKEGRKTAWAVRNSLRYKEVTGEDLVLKPGIKGKVGTVGGFGALLAAGIVHDLGAENPLSPAIGYMGIGSAVIGAVSGEIQIANYNRQLAPVFASLKNIVEES